MSQPATGRGRTSTRHRRPTSGTASFSSTTGSSNSRTSRAPAGGGGAGRRSPAGGRPGGGGGAGGGVRTAPKGRRTASGAPANELSGLDLALAEALTRPQPEPASFADLGVPPLLVQALRRRGLLEPFAIQARALPDAMTGRDVLGRAATGSGKTLAFGLPMLARLAGNDPQLSGHKGVDSAGRRPRRTPNAPRALVLVPSRELALQVTGNLAPLADTLGLKVTSVVGGAPYGRQIDALTRGVDILVATPGRLVDLIERRACRLDQIEITALDEADYMADLGFLPVVTRLMEMTPEGGQRLLFSATLDRGVSKLVDRFLHDPVVHAVATATASIDSMTHRVFVLGRDDKVRIAAEVAGRSARTLFFVRTKHGADRLAKQLARAGVDAAALHGNLAQNARQRVLAAFTDGRTPVLVATDVAARGIHVDGIDLVVHYDPPADHKDYLHRSGRTARAGTDGTVLSFVLSEQAAAVRKLHSDARVDPIVESVSPGHPAVQALLRGA